MFTYDELVSAVKFREAYEQSRYRAPYVLTTKPAENDTSIKQLANPQPLNYLPKLRG